MKMNKLISIVAIFLFTSVIFNAIQWRLHYRLERISFLEDREQIYRNINIYHPNNGLTHADISEVLGALDSTGLLATHHEKRILSIEALHDYAIVEIGYIEDGLDGTGNTFGFIRTLQGWIFDETTRYYGWES